MDLSLMWNYFTSSPNNVAMCNFCQAEINFVDGSTSAMEHHLIQHGLSVEAQKSAMNIEETMPVEKRSKGNLEERSEDRAAKKLKKGIVDEEVSKATKIPFIWTHFDNPMKGKAKCKICDRTFRYKESPTLGMHRHLILHGLFPNDDSLPVLPWTDDTKTSKSWVWKFFRRESTERAKCGVCGKSISTTKNVTGMVKHLQLHDLDEFSTFDEVSDSDEDFLNDESEYFKMPKTVKMSRRKTLQKCFICNETPKTVPTKLSQTLQFSSRTLSTVLEDMTKSKLDKKTVRTSTVCGDCLTALSRYDAYQQKCKEIEVKISSLYKKTHSLPVLSKQEPELFIDDDTDNSFNDSSTNIYIESFQTWEGAILEPENIKIEARSESDAEKSDEAELSDDKPLMTKTKPLYECMKCDMKTKVYREFMKHSKTHEVSECDKCKKLCKDQVNMEIHLIADHSGTDGPYTCPICSKICDNRQKFRYHYRSHKIVKHLLCNTCGATFDHNYALKEHMKIHNDERPFPCEFAGCDKAFRCKSKRAVHHRVHTGEKNYECPYCPGKRFAQSYGRDVHVKKHHSHEVLKEACKICHIKVQSRTELKNHLKNVHQVIEPETTAQAPYSSNSDSD